MKLKIGWVAVLPLLFSSLTVQFSQAGIQGSQTITNYGVIVPNVRIITYFNCSFAYEGPEPYSKGDWWPTWEPCGYPNEKGIWHWVVANRPKEPCGGNMRLVDDPADPTKLCLEMVLDYEGTRPVTDDQDCKLYELQDLNPENYPEPYLTRKEAYYRFKIWVPSTLTVQDRILIWQICGERHVYGTPEHTYAPQISMSFVTQGYDALLFAVSRYYYADDQTRKFQLIKTADFPKDTWVTIEVYVKQGSGFRVEDGTAIIWIEGSKIFEQHDLPTSTYSGTPFFVWGIGNYGSRLELYGTTVLFKDVVVYGLKEG